MDFIQSYLPRQPLHPMAYAHLSKRIIKRQIDQREISTAAIYLQGLALKDLIPIIQKYSNLSGKVFSGYYDELKQKFCISNCPYTGIGAKQDELEKTSFNQTDLDKLIKQVKQSTGRNITAKMYKEINYDFSRIPEYRMVIGLQQGTNGDGEIHSFEKLAFLRLSKIQPIEAKVVKVLVIQPNQELYQEPAIYISIWNNKNSLFAQDAVLEVLEIAQNWNHHVIVEDLLKGTASSYELNGPRVKLTGQIYPGATLEREPTLVEQLHEFKF